MNLQRLWKSEAEMDAGSSAGSPDTSRPRRAVSGNVYIRIFDLSTSPVLSRSPVQDVHITSVIWYRLSFCPLTTAKAGRFPFFHSASTRLPRHSSPPLRPRRSRASVELSLKICDIGPPFASREYGYAERCTGRFILYGGRPRAKVEVAGVLKLPFHCWHRV